MKDFHPLPGLNWSNLIKKKTVMQPENKKYKRKALKKSRTTKIIRVGHINTSVGNKMETCETSHLPVDKKHPTNYEKSKQYWEDVPATVDGVLGGFGFISDVDIQGSKLFLDSLLTLENPPATRLALDCGAGIGRITKHLLLPVFQCVDVIEPDEKFINSLKDYVGPESARIGALYNVGLQKFQPEKTYDVIWNQWVFGYLNDDDLVSYLVHCRDALNPGGMIIVKENVTSSGKMDVDEIDSSVTRPFKQFIKIFKAAALKRVKQFKQTNFPNGIYPVYLFALVPQ